MIKRNNKKGFTIVELVIVIAVIAILAAVLIPTFAGIIRKANISADTQLAKQLNTALTAENVTNDIDDIYEVIEALKAQGFILANLNAKANECYYVWEKDTNQILLVDGKEGYKVLFALNEDYGDIDDSWYFVINDAELAKTVKTAYSTANVISFFDTPDAAEISTPVANVYAAINSKQEGDAGEDLYVKLNTNGSTINKIKIGESVYSDSAEENTFKLSIGSGKFITFKYFNMNDDGTVSVAAPIVAFYTDLKYAVIDNALVLTTGTEKGEGETLSLGDFEYSGIGAYKNDKGQYVIKVKNGSIHQDQFKIAISGASSTDKVIRSSGDGNFGTTELDANVNGAAAYGLYGWWKKTITPDMNGQTTTYNLYVVDKGYVSFDLVLEVVE